MYNSLNMHTRDSRAASVEGIQSPKVIGVQPSTDSAHEQWRPVFRYEARFEISSLGRVRDIVRNKIRAQSVGTSGYKHLNLNGKYHSVHRLIAVAFIPNPYHKKQVNHIDGDKLNNSIANLEWCTARENALHSSRIGTRGVTCHGKLTPDQIREIRSLKGKKSWRTLAREYGVVHTTIGDILNNVTWRNL